jgi:hypothetical protein
MKARPKNISHPPENAPQTGSPTKGEAPHKDQDPHPHDPAIARAQTDRVKNAAQNPGLNEEATDSNEREHLN